MQWDIKVRAAQREYTCSECKKKISEGEIYVNEVVWTRSQGHVTNHLCRRCFNALPAPPILGCGDSGEVS